MNLDEARSIVGKLGLKDSQKTEVDAAFQQDPEGVVRCARDALNLGDRPAALFLSMLRAGDHLREPGNGNGRGITGWRFVRGTHSGTFVRDPKGTDRPPPDYDVTTRGGAREARDLERLDLEEDE